MGNLRDRIAIDIRSNMSRKVIIAIIVGLMVGNSLPAQQDNTYSALKKYSNWGFVAGPVLYTKGKIEPHYGDYTFENKPIWGFNAGFEYDFYPERKWSFTTGLLVALEPSYKIRTTINKEDIYSHFDEDLVDTWNSYAIVSFSAPLLVRLNIQASKNTFVNFQTGLKIMYFPHGESGLSVSVSNQELGESREIFGLNMFSPENALQGSFVIGTGASFIINKVLLKSNLIYVFNFQNTMEGEYRFDNMFVSEPSGGDYTLSGNYLGLLFTVNLTKRKSKW